MTLPTFNFLLLLKVFLVNSRSTHAFYCWRATFPLLLNIDYFGWWIDFFLQTADSYFVRTKVYKSVWLNCRCAIVQSLYKKAHFILRDLKISLKKRGFVTWKVGRVWLIVFQNWAWRKSCKLVIKDFLYVRLFLSTCFIRQLFTHSNVLFIWHGPYEDEILKRIIKVHKLILLSMLRQRGKSF